MQTALGSLMLLLFDLPALPFSGFGILNVALGFVHGPSLMCFSPPLIQDMANVWVTLFKVFFWGP